MHLHNTLKQKQIHVFLGKDNFLYTTEGVYTYWEQL